jgi:hypothetical protein
MRTSKTKKILDYIDKIANAFEIVIALLLLIIIAIKFIELFFEMTEHDIVILNMDFDSILSMTFTLVIGVEFTKMLYKHTPETVIDVLLFATARQTVIYHKDMTDMLIGVLAIAGLFAAKRFLIDNGNNGNNNEDKKD